MAGEKRVEQTGKGRKSRFSWTGSKEDQELGLLNYVELG